MCCHFSNREINTLLLTAHVKEVVTFYDCFAALAYDRGF